MEKGKIIILNGCPSVGKSTIAEEIQLTVDEPYLYAGIDTFVHMIPSSWFVFTNELTKTEGIQFIIGKDEDGKPTIKLGMTPTLEKLMMGYINAVKGLAEAGNNVIVDGVITKKEWFDYIEERFKGFTTCFVGLYAPLDVLEDRERARWEPDGHARGRFEEVYSLQKEYDIYIDTSKSSAEKAAETIVDFIEKQ